MKNVLFVGFLLLSLQVFAQKSIAEEDLPDVIAEGFELAYPDFPPHTWEKRNTRFVATIKYDDRTEYATFLETGEWAETRSKVDKSDLPDNLVSFVESRYDAYRIQTLHYVEENGGGNYYAVLLNLRSNKSLTTELIFDMEGAILMIDGLAVEESEEDHNFTANNDDTPKMLKPGVQKEVIDLHEGVPEIVILNLMKRYGNIEKIKWTQTDLGFRRAEYKFREETIASEWDNEGRQVSVITFFNKKNAIYSIQKYLTENYPKASILKGERIVYETRFTRLFPDKGLKSYFFVEISERPRGTKISNFYTIYFDQTGQLDMIVEQNKESENE
ncbi:MAG: PepSY-like domain-containing protein [Bacteroidales bacterium]|jgi:hypothetical protein|nr:PepSY-like domain-containing protein [Bacteroidales bacterium]